ncbi:dTDP-4-dehydrorhamnose reductase [Novimethylophilus kurashikiensis]|uniref:dTDP-4-dehydrorhamnose reductase n=1 Tax=Novimethylophilus kurashikiensis TaxID=1825523 RepID=A0A2R5F8F2_9PROT|nr:dTDP-4-dehydrorhamnose reductase [Novimethylophilus kurashikiensis]GBG12951.1 dTDP-4-dehydrorhamnose reductase [Novimethylophilus kurashikiensis]
MKTILLTGASGQVGWELQRALAPLGRVVAPSSAVLNLADTDSIRRVIREVRPHLIVNSAAYTAVDRAESEPELAMAVNGTAPGILAEEAKRIHAGLVHYSTDYVFDGTKPGPYRETDPTHPMGVYGSTKLAGEEAIRAVGVPHLIFRTSWVYGVRGRNFVLTILRLANERHELSVVDDQIGTPTWSRLIAQTTALTLSQRDIEEVSGTYHLSAGGSTSWHGVACAVIEEYRARRESVGWPVLRLQPQNIFPISTDQYPTTAQRPANSMLDNGKLAKVFGLALPDWRASLQMALDDAATIAL